MNILLPILGKAEPPKPLLAWLSNQNSMTGKLQKETGLPVTLHVIDQKWMPIGLWEKNVLGLASGSIWMREITISAEDTPCWYARTLIPRETYTSYEVIFSRLKTETLGDIIFSDKRIVRTSLHHYPIDAQSMEYYWLNPLISTDNLWLRLSVFHIEQTHAFYLIEILLPGLMDLQQGTNL
jgi:chorismate--pyruvate lyase